MKPIITTSLITAQGAGSIGAPDRIAEDEARRRRDAERSRLRRHHNESHQHAEAEHRLADAMARASAVKAQLPRTAQPSAEPPEFSSMYQLPKTNDSVGFLNDAEHADVHSQQEQFVTREISATVAAPKDPINSLLQRLARGDSRGLLQDCAPLIEAISAQLADTPLPQTEGRHELGESLACALDFLQGYADAAARRMPGADQVARRAMEVRQQLDALPPGDVTPAVTLVAASQKLATQSGVSGTVLRSTRERDHGNAARKSRETGRRGDTDSDDCFSEATIACMVAGSAGGPQRITSVAESSLSRDQRKRREDTLPLETLRSV